MKLVPIFGGRYAQVDDEDFDLVSKIAWHFDKCPKDRIGYARGRDKKTGKSVSMHRLIMGAAPGQIIDHRDGDGLNNTRANLRFCTASQNRANSTNTYGKSGLRGVSWNKRQKRWIAQIWKGGTQVNLGVFPNPISGAFAYDAEARKVWGEFAKTNFAPLPVLRREQ